MDTSLETTIPLTKPEDQDDTVDKQPRALHTQLIPPDNTSNWGRETLNIFNNTPVTWRNGASAGTITWNVDVYKGEIVLLFVHSGTVRLGSIYYERQFQVSVGSGDSVTAVKQAPPYGTQNGDYYDHTIDYKETLQLRRNNGTELFPWEVIYYETFARGQNAQQTGSLSGHLEADSAVAYWKNPSNPQSMSFPIKGITVFKARNPSRFPLRFSIGSDTEMEAMYVFANNVQFLNLSNGPQVLQ
ncbi:hypothetical protein ONZ45_g14346 [Pleurotus djamor]|nr:hypothetical protein ONZ45_g14346 [Pleurotus djamor]